MIELAITLGLIFSLLSYEVFGLAAGGIVVPGYIALLLSQPDRLAGIVLVSLSTYPCNKAGWELCFPLRQKTDGFMPAGRLPAGEHIPPVPDI